MKISTMKSSACLLVLLTVLELIQTLPAPTFKSEQVACKIDRMIQEYVKPNLNNSFKLYLLANGNSTQPQKDIEGLKIPHENAAIKQKNQSALCGTKFMLDAITLIRNNHTSEHIASEKDLREVLQATNKSLTNLLNCVNSFFGKQKCQSPVVLQVPPFSYGKKQWSCGVLQQSLEFVSWLQNFMQRPKHHKV